MEQEVFITPNLFIRENNIYYLNDKTKKEIKVTLKNWHKYLSDYGWEKMELGWKRRLKRCRSFNSSPSNKYVY